MTHHDETAATQLAGAHVVNVIRSTSADLLPLPHQTTATIDWSECKCTCEARRAPALNLSGMHFAALGSDPFGARAEHHYSLAQAWVRYSRAQTERCARHCNGNNW